MHPVTGHKQEGYDVQATNVDDTCLTPRISSFSSNGLDWSVQSREIRYRRRLERASPSGVVWGNSLKVKMEGVQYSGWGKPGGVGYGTPGRYPGVG